MGLRGFRAALLACALVATASGAEAASAVAIGDAGNAATHGLASGFAHDYGSRLEAESDALKQCHATSNAPQPTRALCRVVAHFDNQCFAIAIDPADNTPGWGWAIAQTPSRAAELALVNCRKTAGARADYCIVGGHQCDGVAN
jgi:hypothetical protein